MRKNQILINKNSDQDIIAGKITTITGSVVHVATVRIESVPPYETTPWAAGVWKSVGDRVVATVDNNHEYCCLVKGTTGGTEPAWSTGGELIEDGDDIIWEDIGVYDGENLLNYVRFYYHCSPGNIKDAYQAFTVNDDVLVVKEGASHYIVGFKDLKPRPCELHILGGTDGSKGRILESLDMGETWTNLGQLFGQQTIRGIVGLEGGIVLAGTRPGGKIIRSINKGESWTDLGQMFGQTWILDIIDLGNGICLAGTNPGGKILRSVDYGLSWTDLGQQFSQTTITELASMGAGRCLAVSQATVEDREVAKILRSIDYGKSWSVVWVWSNEEQHYQLESVAYLESGICIAGSGFYGYPLISGDYGLTWSIIGIETGVGWWEAPTYVGNGICLWGYHKSYDDYGGYIWRSVDYGVNWVNLGRMFNETWIYELAYVGKGICLAGTGLNGKILRSVDKGLHWTDLGNQTGLSNPCGITSLKRINVGF